MRELIGEKTTYVILQERGEAQDGVIDRVPLIYNAGYGSFSSIDDVLLATHFDSKEDAIELADLQNEISRILKQDFNYIVIENFVRRNLVENEVQEEEPQE